MYGQTEAAPRMSWLSPELAAEAPGSIGRAIPGGALSVVDAAGRIR
jgi:acyl-coenzyme A synthetase/AMP-(fatty) acid ligase